MFFYLFWFFFFFFFFFNDTATTEIYTLSLHDALPITCRVGGRVAADAGFCSPLVTSLWAWSVVCHFRRDDASVAAVRQVPGMRSVSATASPHAGQSPPGPMR